MAGEDAPRWGVAFSDQVVAAAMIDRIVHHADVITLKGSCTGSGHGIDATRRPQEGSSTFDVTSGVHATLRAAL